MWQSIITLIIIAIAAYFAIRPYFKKKSEISEGCNGCSSTCSGCPVMDIKTEKK